MKESSRGNKPVPWPELKRGSASSGESVAYLSCEINIVSFEILNREIV
jgi:hypothetical protein